MAHTFAVDIATYVYNETKLLQAKLADHFKQVDTVYPKALVERGMSEYKAASLVRSYEQECTAVERILLLLLDRTQAIRASEPVAYTTTQLLVGTRSQQFLDVLERELEAFGIVERFSYIPYVVLYTDEPSATQLLTRPKNVFKDRRVAVYAPGVYRVQPREEVFHRERWNLDLIDAPKAWKKTKGRGAVVAVIDTGIDYEHNELRDRFGSVKGIDFVDDNDPIDDNGHGSHVAGIVAGKFVGVAPEAMLYAVKVLDGSGVGSEVAVLKGIEWAIEKKVGTINMSLGSSYASDAEAKLVAYAAKQGISVVCAAGNDGNNRYNYPASHPGAISVAAIDSDKKKAPFSNYNDMVDLAAPGVSIYSTWKDGSYNVLSGTSMATPHVAGACALLNALAIENPEEKLKQSAEKLGPTDCYGSGLIHVGDAL